jgi:uncharacterized cupin superfamily protein
MQVLTKPALDPLTLAPQTSSGYPKPYRSRVLPREKRRFGDALGLTKIGVNLTTAHQPQRRARGVSRGQQSRPAGG